MADVPKQPTTMYHMANNLFFGAFDDGCVRIIQLNESPKSLPRVTDNFYTKSNRPYDDGVYADVGPYSLFDVTITPGWWLSIVQYIGAKDVNQSLLAACKGLLNAHECIIEDGDRRTPEGEAARHAIASAELDAR